MVGKASALEKKISGFAFRCRPVEMFPKAPCCWHQNAHFLWRLACIYGRKRCTSYGCVLNFQPIGLSVLFALSFHPLQVSVRFGSSLASCALNVHPFRVSVRIVSSKETTYGCNLNFQSLGLSVRFAWSFHPLRVSARFGLRLASRLFWIQMPQWLRPPFLVLLHLIN